jgi:tripartite-type tricarboxylate transporter receptor subunit TctC
MSEVSRRGLLTLLGASFAAPSLAAGYPDHPLRIIVPYAPGSNSDVQARIVGAAMSDRLGQPIIAENRPGAGGSIGAAAVAKVRADGYTLLLGSNGPLTITPFLQANLPYDPLKDLLPVGLISRMPQVIAVPTASPFRSFAALLEAARMRPGQISIGSSGTGSGTHMTLELLMAASRARLNHVPYRGSSATATDLVAGTLDSAIIEFSTVLPMIRDGQVRLLASASAARLPLAPDVPTLIESGMTDLIGASYNGLVAPAGTPPAVMATLSGALAAALNAPAVRERMQEIGSEVAGPWEASPEGFAEFIRAEYARSRRAVELAGLKAE